MSATLAVGTRVRVELHAIGGRSEVVTGVVVGRNRRGTLNEVRFGPQVGYGPVMAADGDLIVEPVG